MAVSLPVGCIIILVIILQSNNRISNQQKLNIAGFFIFSNTISDPHFHFVFFSYLTWLILPFSQNWQLFWNPFYFWDYDRYASYYICNQARISLLNTSFSITKRIFDYHLVLNIRNVNILWRKIIKKQKKNWKLSGYML